MKKHILYLIMLLLSWSNIIPCAWAQDNVDYEENGNRLFIFLNDSIPLSWEEGDEWTIRFSNKDTLANLHEFPVAFNFINTSNEDSIYLRLHSVDSVLCQTPTTVYADNVYLITEKHFPYILETDSFTTITFNAKCQEHFPLPKMGQKVYSDLMVNPLPYGFIGEVVEKKEDNENGKVTIKCKYVIISEIFDRLYKSESKNPNPSKTRKFHNTILSNKYGTPDTSVPIDVIKTDIDADGMKISPGFQLIFNTYSNTLVDKSKNMDSESWVGEAFFEFNVDMTFDINKSAPEQKKQHLPRAVWKIPTTVPGMAIALKLGPYYDYKLAASGTYTVKKTESKAIQYIRKGHDYTVSFSDGNDDNDTEDLDLITIKSEEGALNLKIEGFAEIGINAGIGIDLGAGTLGITEEAVCALGISSEFNLNMLQDCTEWDENGKPQTKSSLFDEKYNILKNFQSTSLYLKSGTNLKLSCLDDKFTISLSGAMHGGNIEHKYNLMDFSWAPDIQLTRNSSFPGKWIGNFKWSNPSYVSLNTKLFLKNTSKAETIEKSPQCEKNYSIPFYKVFKPLSYPISTPIEIDYNSFKENIKGKTWTFQPTVELPLLGECGPELGHFYAQYYVETTDFEQDYHFYTVKGKVDPEILKDPTQKLVINIEREEKYKEEGNIEIEVPKECTDNEGNVLYKGNFEDLPSSGTNTIYLCAQSTTEGEVSKDYGIKFRKLNSIQPTYKGFSDMTHHSATLDFELSSSLGGILKKEGVTDFYVTVEYWEEDDKEQNLKATSTMLQSKECEDNYKVTSVTLINLKPSTNYCAKAYVYFNDKKHYNPNIIKFKTHSCVYDLKADAGTNVVSVSAKIPLSIPKIDKYSSVTFFWAVDEDMKSLCDENGVMVPYDQWEKEDDYWLVRAQISNNIEPNSTYYFNAIANIDDKEIISETGKFITENPFETLMKPVKVKGKEVTFCCEMDENTKKNIRNGEYYAKIYFEYSLDKDFKECKSIAADEELYDEGKEIKLSTEVEEYGTTYYARFKVIDNNDLPIYSNVVSFKTDDLLSCKTLSASVSLNKAIFEGEISEFSYNWLMESDSRYAYFEYAKSSDFKQSESMGADLEEGRHLQTEVEGLDFNTKYFVRLVIGNNEHKAHSNVQTFTTPNPYEIFTKEAVVEDATVTMKGQLSSLAIKTLNSDSHNTIYPGFMYATSKAELSPEGDCISVKATDINKVSGAFSIDQILEPNTTYYFKAFLYVDGNIFQAKEICSFKTLDYDPGLIPLLKKKGTKNGTKK